MAEEGGLLTVQLSIDAKGLACPLPIIRAKRGISQIEVGEILEIWTTDPGSLEDFRAWCRSTGHELVKQAGEAPPYQFWIRRTR